jgi:hypothetical protein
VATCVSWFTTGCDHIATIRFSRLAAHVSVLHEEGKPEAFNFLGHTHFCANTRRGGFRLGRKMMNKWLRQQIKSAHAELRLRMHEPTGATLKWLRSVITGYMNDYSVAGNRHSYCDP